MEPLPPRLFTSFVIGLTHRVSGKQQFTLLPVIGALRWSGKLNFCNFFVDSLNPYSVSKILIKGKSITSDDVEAKVQEGVEGHSIYYKWIKLMNLGDLTNKHYTLLLWSDIDTNCSVFKPFIKDKDSFTLGETDQSLARIFFHTNPCFTHEIKASVCVCVLKDCANITAICPDGYVIKKLTTQDAELALESYKFAFEFRYNLQLCAANGFGVGAYDSEGNLASSVFVSSHGAISALQTFSGHRRKGLARAVVSHLVELLKEANYPVVCYVEPDIEVNIQMFQKLGFQIHFDSVVSLWSTK